METMICQDGWVEELADSDVVQPCMCNPTGNRNHECVQDCHRPNITILDGLPT
jgi:hypothetical protein